jgi:hypothetical protein
LIKILIKKKAQIALIAICVVMLLLTIFLASLAVMFSGSGNSRRAPELFGSNLYLVKGDTFDLIKPPSAVIGEKVEISSLGAGDIVIFETENGKSIGEIISKNENNEPDTSEAADSNEADNTADIPEAEVTATSFSIRDELSSEIIVTDDSIIAKATKTSRFFGFIISFITSSAGVLVIAVIPCVCLILWEIVRPIINRGRGVGVAPVNKQAETPTFVPPVPIEEIELTKADKSAAVLKAYKQTINPNTDSDTSSTGSRNEGSENKKAPIKSVVLEKSKPNIKQPSQEFEEPKLFTQVEKPMYEKPVESPPLEEILQKQVIKPPPPPSKKKKPLSSVKLAEAIAAVNSQKDTSETSKEISASEKSKLIEKAMEDFKKDKQS